MLVVASAVAAFVPPPATARSRIGPAPRPPGHAKLLGATGLWHGVLVRAVLDSFGLDLSNDDRATRQLVVDRARTWLGRATPDRDAVCDLAGILPAALDRALPRLRALWAMADAGQLAPEVVAIRGAPGRACFGRPGGEKAKENAEPIVMTCRSSTSTPIPSGLTTNA